MKKQKMRYAKTTDEIEANVIREYLEASGFEWGEQIEYRIAARDLYTFRCRMSEGTMREVNNYFGYELFV